MKTKTSSRSKKSAAWWIANHERMLNPPPCKYGHFDCSCSATEGGPCLNEMFARLAETDTDN